MQVKKENVITQIFYFIKKNATTYFHSSTIKFHKLVMAMFFRSLILPMNNSNVASTMMRMMSVTFSFNYSFESTVWARFIFDHTVSTIGFFQAISPCKVFAISMFVLVFDVMCMWIMDTVFKFVVTLIETKGK